MTVVVVVETPDWMRRNSPIDNRESLNADSCKSLFAAVIQQAIQDMNSAKCYRQDAEQFFISGRADGYLEAIGVDPALFKRVLFETGGKIRQKRPRVSRKRRGAKCQQTTDTT